MGTCYMADGSAWRSGQKQPEREATGATLKVEELSRALEAAVARARAAEAERDRLRGALEVLALAAEGVKMSRSFEVLRALSSAQGDARAALAPAPGEGGGA